MRVNRGCGCSLLILAGLNFLFVVLAIIGLTGGNLSVGLGMLALALFGANLVASLMLGLAGFRRQPIASGSGFEEPELVGGIDEGETGVDEGSE